MVWLTLAAGAAYLLAGCYLALRALPKTWETARSRWGPDHPDDTRIEVRAETIGMTLFWPLFLTGRTFLNMVDATLNHAEVKQFRQQLDATSDITRTSNQ